MEARIKPTLLAALVGVVHAPQLHADLLTNPINPGKPQEFYQLSEP